MTRMEELQILVGARNSRELLLTDKKVTIRVWIYKF